MHSGQTLLPLPVGDTQQSPKAGSAERRQGRDSAGATGAAFAGLLEEARGRCRPVTDSRPSGPRSGEIRGPEPDEDGRRAPGAAQEDEAARADQVTQTDQVTRMDQVTRAAEVVVDPGQSGAASRTLPAEPSSSDVSGQGSGVGMSPQPDTTAAFPALGTAQPGPVPAPRQGGPGKARGAARLESEAAGPAGQAVPAPTPGGSGSEPVGDVVVGKPDPVDPRPSGGPPNMTPSEGKAATGTGPGFGPETPDRAAGKVVENVIQGAIPRAHGAERTPDAAEAGRGHTGPAAGAAPVTVPSGGEQTTRPTASAWQPEAVGVVGRTGGVPPASEGQTGQPPAAAASGGLPPGQPLHRDGGMTPDSPAAAGTDRVHRGQSPAVMRAAPEEGAVESAGGLQRRSGEQVRTGSFAEGAAAPRAAREAAVPGDRTPADAATGTAPGTTPQGPETVGEVADLANLGRGRGPEAPTPTATQSPEAGVVEARDPESLAQAVMERIRSARVGAATDSGGTAVRLRLHPDSLGELTVRLAWEEGRVSASFQTATASARDTINEHLTELRQHLEAGGLRLGSLDVGIGDPRGGANHAGEPPPGPQVPGWSRPGPAGGTVAETESGALGRTYRPESTVDFLA